jgi:hypothetical protein
MRSLFSSMGSGKSAFPWNWLFAEEKVEKKL